MSEKRGVYGTDLESRTRVGGTRMSNYHPKEKRLPVGLGPGGKKRVFSSPLDKRRRLILLRSKCLGHNIISDHLFKGK